MADSVVSSAPKKSRRWLRRLTVGAGALLALLIVTYFVVTSAAFVKGAADAEGLAVLAMARQMLAGERVGAVPPEAGQPPIVIDFRVTAERLGLDRDKIRATETYLDLYRRATHREISRFFYRLRYLEVPFGELVRGPSRNSGPPRAPHAMRTASPLPDDP